MKVKRVRTEEDVEEAWQMSLTCHSMEANILRAVGKNSTSCKILLIYVTFRVETKRTQRSKLLPAESWLFLGVA